MKTGSEQQINIRVRYYLILNYFKAIQNNLEQFQNAQQQYQRHELQDIPQFTCGQGSA